MKQPDSSVLRWPLLAALLCGNFIIGVGVLMPAGLLNELAQAFNKDPATIAKLIGYGALVLCVQAPLFAVMMNTVDRRWLLTGALVVYAVGHLVSAFATDFTTLLVSRLVMIGGAAIFTPQAASTVGLLSTPAQRATMVATIFLGWPLASAIGVPLTSFLGAITNWSTAYLIMSGLCVVAAIAVFVNLPSGLHAPKLSLTFWRDVFANRAIPGLLAITCLFCIGVMVVYPYLAAALKSQHDASPGRIAGMFAVYGVAGVVGSLVSARVIGKWSAPRTVTVHLGFILLGLLCWSLDGLAWFSDTYFWVVAGLVAWGYGGAPVTAGQQTRLIAIDPQAASISVALNASVIYGGSAIGTVIGGMLWRNDMGAWGGWVASVLLVVALLASVAVHRKYQA